MALRKVGNGIQTLYGQFTVSAPSPGGTGITINAGAAPGIDINAAANSYGVRVFGSSTASQSLGLIIKAGTNSSDFALAVQNQAAATMMNVNGAGNVAISAPSSGVALTVNGVASSFSSLITSPNTAGVSNGLKVQAGTNTSDNAFLVANAAGSSMLAVQGGGNVIVLAPASGTGLSVTGLAGGNVSALLVSASPGTAPATADIGRIVSINNTSTAGGDQRLLDIGQVGANAFLRPVLSGAGPTAAGLLISTNAGGTTFGAVGNVTISAPTSGTTLVASGASGQTVINASINGTGNGLFISGPAATFSNALSLTQSGQSNWVLQFIASTNNIKFTTGGTDNFTWTGGGGVQVGAPTGGDKGAGTLNATNLYINGVAVAAGGVTSVTGTANQVTASPTTGAVIVGLPVNVVIPAASSGVALSVSSSTATTATLSVSSSGLGAIGIQVDSTNANVGGIVVLSNSTTIFGSIESGKANSITGVLGDMCVVAKTNSLVLATGTTPRMTVLSTGGVIVGAATDQGAGTLAALTQLYVGTVPLYRTGTFTGTFTGMTAGTTATVTYIISGNTVTLSFTNITGTSNTTSMTMTGLPAVCQPTAQRSAIACMLQDNGSIVSGFANIDFGSGTITFYRDVLATGVYSPTGFTATGSKGMFFTSITYLLL